MAYITVDVDLCEFSDEEIAREYRERQLDQLADHYSAEDRCRQLAEHIRSGRIEVTGQYGHELVDFVFDIANKIA